MKTVTIEDIVKKFGGLASTWDDFISLLTRKYKLVQDRKLPEIVSVDACLECKGRLTMVVSTDVPMLFVVCASCGIVFSVFKLQRDQNVA